MMKLVAVISLASFTLLGCTWNKHEETCADITKTMIDKNIMAFSSYGEMEDPRMFLTFFQNQIGVVEYSSSSKDMTGVCEGIADVTYTANGEERKATLSISLTYDEIGDVIRWRTNEIALL